MSVACLLITDGRPCLQETLASAEEYLFPYLDGPTVLVSDTTHKLGLSGAIREGWRRLGECEAYCTPAFEYVFHLEDDFVFTEPVPVDDMVNLCEREKLAQVALRRDFIPGAEPPGGFYELHPERYTQRDGWVESLFGFTFNPCVYPLNRYVTHMNDWQGESGLTAEIRANVPQEGGWYDRFAIYGDLTDPPRCFHIGLHRSAGWKL